MSYLNVLWLDSKSGMHAFVTEERIDKLTALIATCILGGMPEEKAAMQSLTVESKADFFNLYFEGTVYGAVAIADSLVAQARQTAEQHAPSKDLNGDNAILQCLWCDTVLDTKNDIIDCSKCGKQICNNCAIEYIAGGFLCDNCWRTMYTYDEEGATSG